MAQADGNGRRAVFDIGSNSVRFVAYDGPPRAPMPIYNEKWPISLGQMVRDHGAIDEPSMAHLLAGVGRFVKLAGYMEISDIKAVATAAIREARNGDEFIAGAARLGLTIEQLDGAQEAQAAGYGVLCNYGDVDGYVADLGGGSLEIARITSGKVTPLASLPLGTAKLLGRDEDGWRAAATAIRDALAKHKQQGLIRAGRNLYMVGGTWRAAAHLHQHMTQYPIRILSHYEIAPGTLLQLQAGCEDEELKASLQTVSAQRSQLMPVAARMLGVLNDILEPSCFISSALGIREGLLFGQLSSEERADDPLLSGARFRGSRMGRRNFNGDRLFHWMQGLFADYDEGDDRRLRHAACLLADCAWNIHPDYRSAHALQTGIEGNWLGVDGAGRALIARALWSAYGDSKNDRALLSKLADRRALRRADKWGLAIRLAMRIDGGTGGILERSTIAIHGDELLLTLPPDTPGDTIIHRLEKLASGTGLTARLK